LLLDTTPSDALLDAAAAGKLDSIEALEETARRMLNDPRARDVMRDFHGQLYRVDSPWPTSSAALPEYATLHAELVESSYRFFDDVFNQDHGLREIFTSDRGFVGPRLAPIYGITPLPSAIEARALGASRIGYFMQVPFLLLNGSDGDPDSIHRGAAVLERVLCVTVGAPLPIVTIPPLAPNQTNRQRISALTDSCGFGCHRDHINPLGFAFENFDGIGQERQTDNHLPVDTSGRYPFAEGVKDFANAKELMTILANRLRPIVAGASDELKPAVQAIIEFTDESAKESPDAEKLADLQDDYQKAGATFTELCQ